MKRCKACGGMEYDGFPEGDDVCLCKLPEEDERNPAHYCMGMDCKEWVGHRGWCSEKCYNSSYPTTHKPSKEMKDGK